MRKWIAALCILSITTTTPVYAATTSASSSSTVTNSATANSGPGGFANSSSFGLAGSIIAVAPNAASTTSFQTNQVRGLAIGNATFSGMSTTQTRAMGMSTAP